jgi:lipid II:glycine glycyltransferase (peptidoglycan interpeptide bridge formation enzyme)
VTEEFDIIELERSGSSESTMRAAQYEATERWTYCVPLASDRETMVKRMSKGRRYGIKKATKAGLTVEESTDLAFADEFYEQFCALMAAKRAKPIFGMEVPRAMMKHLAGTGRLLALRVREDSGAVLATGLFPLDNRTLYYWGGASRLDRRQLCPNDLMHWHAMCVAADLGMESYDMSGWGRFKKEFGGQLVTTRRWHKSYSRSARWARRGYEFYFLQRLRVLGWIANKVQRQGA